jgi:hypothetical protein
MFGGHWRPLNVAQSSRRRHGRITQIVVVTECLGDGQAITVTVQSNSVLDNANLVAGGVPGQTTGDPAGLSSIEFSRSSLSVPSVSLLSCAGGELLVRSPQGAPPRHIPEVQDS